MDLGIDLGPHASFIWLSYAIVTLVIASIVAWLVMDGRVQERRLADLAARGVKRRSAQRT